MIKRSLAAIAFAALAFGYHIVLNTTHHNPVPHWMTVRCAQEDSVNCFWDARRAGNHTGHSFYVRAMPHVPGYRHPLICVFYVDRSRWDYCNAA